MKMTIPIRKNKDNVGSVEVNAQYSETGNTLRFPAGFDVSNIVVEE